MSDAEQHPLLWKRLGTARVHFREREGGLPVLYAWEKRSESRRSTVMSACYVKRTRILLSWDDSMMRMWKWKQREMPDERVDLPALSNAKTDQRVHIIEGSG